MSYIDVFSVELHRQRPGEGKLRAWFALGRDEDERFRVDQREEHAVPG